MALASGGACGVLKSFSHPRAAEKAVRIGKICSTFGCFPMHLTQEAQIGTPLPEARDSTANEAVRGPSPEHGVDRAAWVQRGPTRARSCVTCLPCVRRCAGMEHSATLLLSMSAAVACCTSGPDGESAVFTLAT